MNIPCFAFGRQKYGPSHDWRLNVLTVVGLVSQLAARWAAADSAERDTERPYVRGSKLVRSSHTARRLHSPVASHSPLSRAAVICRLTACPAQKTVCSVWPIVCSDQPIVCPVRQSVRVQYPVPTRPEASPAVQSPARHPDLQSSLGAERPISVHNRPKLRDAQ